jgi:hypothetical protein
LYLGLSTVLIKFFIYLYKILAMRHPRKLVLAGCLSALTVRILKHALMQ